MTTARFWLLLMLATPSLAAPAQAPVDADYVQAHADELVTLRDQDPVRAAAVEAFLQAPQLAEQAAGAHALGTRAGAMRLVDAPDDPRVAAVHLDHALYGAPDTRAAHARLGAEMIQDAGVLRAALAQSAPEVRAAALAGLHRRPEAVWTRVLADSLQDDQAPVRRAAASLLGRRADAPQHLRALEQASADSDAEVRRLAVRALGVYGASAQVGAVQARLSDADPGVRLAAIHAIERLAPSQAASLTELLRADADAGVRRAARALQ